MQNISSPLDLQVEAVAEMGLDNQVNYDRTLLDL